MTTKAPPSLLTTHGRNLRTYRRELTAALAQLDVFQSTITSLQATLAETRADEAFWKQRVEELDKRTRVQALEITAAARSRREAEQECARLRVDLEDMRRGIKRVRRNLVGISVMDHEAQTDDEEGEKDVVREWFQHTGMVVGECGCGAAQAVKGLFGPEDKVKRVEDKGKGRGIVVEGRGELGSRERRQNLRAKLKATKDRVNGRLGGEGSGGDDGTVGSGYGWHGRERGGGTMRNRAR